MRTINYTPRHLRDLDFVIAQLRHAYTHLLAERVTKQRMFAEGLIAPQIEDLETIRRNLAAQAGEAGTAETPKSGSARRASTRSRRDAPNV